MRCGTRVSEEGVKAGAFVDFVEVGERLPWWRMREPSREVTGGR